MSKVCHWYSELGWLESAIKGVLSLVYRKERERFVLWPERRNEECGTWAPCHWGWQVWTNRGRSVHPISPVSILSFKCEVWSADWDFQKGQCASFANEFFISNSCLCPCELSLLSRQKGELESVVTSIDVPVLMMSPCGRGATSSAS